MSKDSEKTTKGERNKDISDRGRDMTMEGDQLKFFKHASRGSKLMNLYDAFECAFHIFACMTQVFNFQYPCLCGIC